MPNHPQLKLCLTCDQISFTRARSRELRCNRPVPPRGAPCRSRRVRLITIEELNLERQLLVAEITGLKTASANHEARIGELEEMFDEFRKGRK